MAYSFIRFRLWDRFGGNTPPNRTSQFFAQIYQMTANDSKYSATFFFLTEHSALLIKQHQYKGFAGCNPEQSKKLD
jgi:hypothetical protein